MGVAPSRALSLEDRSTSSASGGPVLLTRYGEIRGEIRGDVPLLGSLPSAKSESTREKSGTHRTPPEAREMMPGRISISCPT